MSKHPDLLQALQDSVDKARTRRRIWKYNDAVAKGAELFGGHLGTCRGLNGGLYCTCGKEEL